MIPVKEMVKSGYKSLAERTLDDLEILRNAYPEQVRNFKELDTYVHKLEMLKNTGDITSLGEDTSEIFHDVICLFENSIPSGLKPKDVNTVLGMATSGVRADKNIETVPELFSKAKISDFEISNNECRIILTESKDENPKRIYLVQYTPERPAYSVLVNIHELIHALQPEMDTIYDTLKGLQEINGFSSLMNSIYEDPKLKNDMIDIISSTHMLRFLDNVEVRNLSEKLEVDMDAYNGFLEEKIPLIDFLSCYIEGDAYLTQTDIISKIPDLEGKEGLILYKLLSLTDSLVAAFEKPKPTVYMVGIGLVEYMRNNPDLATEIMISNKFHKELSQTYF